MYKDIVMKETEENYEHKKFCKALDEILDNLRNILKEKNKKYGNSALDPIRIFSKTNPKEQIKVRLDDKISRLTLGSGEDTEDVFIDLTGYLILYMILDKKLI